MTVLRAREALLSSQPAKVNNERKMVSVQEYASINRLLNGKEDNNEYDQLTKKYGWDNLGEKRDNKGYFGQIYINAELKQIVLGYRTKKIDSIKILTTYDYLKSNPMHESDPEYSLLMQAVEMANEKKYHLTITGVGPAAYIAVRLTYLAKPSFPSVSAMIFASPSLSNDNLKEHGLGELNIVHFDDYLNDHKLISVSSPKP